MAHALLPSTPYFLSLQKHGTCTLGCAKVQASGHTESLAQLSMSCTLELSRDLNLETVGTDFGGLISRDKALVKTGDYIKFSTSTEVCQCPL